MRCEMEECHRCEYRVRHEMMHHVPGRRACDPGRHCRTSSNTESQRLDDRGSER